MTLREGTSDVNDDWSDEKLVVFPNSAIQQIQTVNEADFDGHFEIYGMMDMLQLQSNEKTIPIYYLADGVYILVKKYSNGRLKSARFVKY